MGRRSRICVRLHAEKLAGRRAALRPALPCRGAGEDTASGQTGASWLSFVPEAVIRLPPVSLRFGPEAAHVQEPEVVR